MVKLNRISVFLSLLVGQAIGGSIVSDSNCQNVYYCHSGTNKKRFNCNTFDNPNSINLENGQWKLIQECPSLEYLGEFDDTKNEKSCWPDVNLLGKDEIKHKMKWTMYEVRGGVGITERGYCMKGDPWRTKNWYSLFREDCSIVTCNKIKKHRDLMVYAKGCVDMNNNKINDVTVPYEKQAKCPTKKKKILGKIFCGRTLKELKTSTSETYCVKTEGNYCYSFQDGWCERIIPPKYKGIRKCKPK